MVRIAFLSLLVAGLFIGSASAQEPGSETLLSPRLVDRIVAIVDEEAILLSDLEREIETYHFEMESMGQSVTESDGAVREKMLDRLIEVKLLVAQAKLDGMVLGEEELDRETAQATQRLIDRFGTRTAPRWCTTASGGGKSSARSVSPIPTATCLARRPSTSCCTSTGGTRRRIPQRILRRPSRSGSSPGLAGNPTIGAAG